MVAWTLDPAVLRRSRGRRWRERIRAEVADYVNCYTSWISYLRLLRSSDVASVLARRRYSVICY